MPIGYRCPYCLHVTETEDGLSKHISRVPECALARDREIEACVKKSRLWHADDPEEIEFPSPPPPDLFMQFVQAVEREAMELDSSGTFSGDKVYNKLTKDTSSGSIQHNSETRARHCATTVVERHPQADAGAPLSYEPIEEEEDNPWLTGRLSHEALFEFAQWMRTVHVSGEERNWFFKLKLMQHLPWKNDRQFMKDIDLLPHGLEWTTHEITIEGDNGTETVELWSRNSLDMVKQLIGNPRFKDHMQYAPVREYTDMSQKNRVYGQAWSTNWWWRMQTLIGTPHATIIPVIGSSDKTQLSVMSGGKKAWPVYASIGNISKEVRRSPLMRGFMLLAYIPVSTLACIRDPTQRCDKAREVFHACMAKIWEPLLETSTKGVKVRCADAAIRLGFPTLASYIGDFEEQCDVCCTQQSRCPKCVEEHSSRGELGPPAAQRTKREAALALLLHNTGSSAMLNQIGMRPTKPFWAHLPNVNIFNSITPDLLHQLHTGMFLDHVVKWMIILVGSDIIDARCRAMTPHYEIRHFVHGLSVVWQWTGREAKDIAKIFLPMVIDSAPRDAVRATRLMLDFMYKAHAHALTDEDLDEMDAALAGFHKLKDVFISAGALDTLQGFNGIPKLHMLRHITESICEHGSPDGYNSEMTEHLHIDYPKEGYRASNKVDATEQMAMFIQRKEAIALHDAHLQRLQGTDMHRGKQRKMSWWEITSRIGDYEDDSDEELGEEEWLKRPLVRVVQLRVDPGMPYHPEPQIRLAKQAMWPSVPGTFLIDNLKADQLLDAVRHFLVARYPALQGKTLLVEDHRFNVWSQLKLFHDPTPFRPAEPPKTNLVRAAPPTRKRRRGFDTVLIPFFKEYEGLHRYRAARVRAIFELPQHLRQLYDGKLAYIELFGRFSAKPSAVHGYYSTTRSFFHGRRSVTLIPVHDIRMTCHLSPHFASLDPKIALTSDTDLLNVCNNFHVNPFGNYYSYQLLEYWQRTVPPYK